MKKGPIVYITDYDRVTFLHAAYGSLRAFLCNIFQVTLVDTITKLYKSSFEHFWLLLFRVSIYSLVSIPDLYCR